MICHQSSAHLPAVQLKDFQLVDIEFDVSAIDPLKAKADSFHHQDLKNDSPGSLKTTVQGQKKQSKVRGGAPSSEHAIMYHLSSPSDGNHDVYRHRHLQ